MTTVSKWILQTSHTNRVLGVYNSRELVIQALEQHMKQDVINSLAKPLQKWHNNYAPPAPNDDAILYSLTKSYVIYKTMVDYDSE